MGLFSSSGTETYNTGADRWNQNSRAYLLAAIAYLGIFLFGYDAGVAGGIVSLPAFRHDFKYGKEFGSTDKQINDHSSNVVSLLMAGAFFGALGAAPICSKLGRKWALMLGTVIFAVGAAAQTAAMHKLDGMIAGRVISGFGVGIMSTVCPTYVSEMTPKNVRGRITGLFQIVVVVGVAVSYWLEYIINVRMKPQTAQWRIPIGFQIAPAGLMIILLPFIKESPRWLVSKGKNELALANLAWVRKRSPDDPMVMEEYTEIVAANQEEVDNTSGAEFGELFKPGMRIRTFIAFTMFFLQQWAGQNSISYYAPQIFSSIGLKGVSVGLLASGIYGIVKIVATSLFIFVGIERTGRSAALGWGGLGMSLFLWIVGAIFNTNPPDPKALSPSGASIGMAVCIYLFVIPYCFGWGPVPWVYCSEIFPMRVRSYGMAVAAATQWAFNFTMSKITPYLIVGMPHGGIFFLFAAINLLSAAFGFWIPETRGLSIEQMDVLFGSTTQEEHDRYVAAAQKTADSNALYRGDGLNYVENEKKEEEIEHKERV